MVPKFHWSEERIFTMVPKVGLGFCQESSLRYEHSAQRSRRLSKNAVHKSSGFAWMEVLIYRDLYIYVAYNFLLLHL